MSRKNKTCPFLNQNCLKNDCGVFNDKFNRCDIGLLAYNAYLFSNEVGRLSDILESLKSDDKETESFENNGETKFNPLKDALRL